uniref:Uncharacterized protein n=1 Tax=Romanomermis culicivorax TaxID=13658 RepID=A0A915I7C1_ROMCU
MDVGYLLEANHYDEIKAELQALRQAAHLSKHSEAKNEDTVAKKSKTESDAHKEKIYKLSNDNEASIDNEGPMIISPVGSPTPGTSTESQPKSRNTSSQSSLDRFCGPSRQMPSIDQLMFSWLADATLPYLTIDNPRFRVLIEAVNAVTYKHAIPQEGKMRLAVGPKTLCLGIKLIWNELQKRIRELVDLTITEIIVILEHEMEKNKCHISTGGMFTAFSKIERSSTIKVLVKLNSSSFLRHNLYKLLPISRLMRA